MPGPYGKFHHVAAGADGRSYWAVQAEPHVMGKLKRIFPRARQERTRLLLLADTAEVARDLEWFMDRWPLAPGNPHSLARLEAQATAHRNGEDTVQRILEGHQPAYGWPEPARPPRDYQQQAADLVHATGRLLLGDDLGLGKAQPLDAAVLTPTGFRPLGTLTVGDQVVAADATTTEIIGVFPQGVLDCYRVTFTDGAAVECSADHLWRVRDATDPSGAWQTLTLDQIVRHGLGCADMPDTARWHIPMLAAPDLGNSSNAGVDPYRLGRRLARRRPAPPTGVPDAHKHAPAADRLALLHGLMDAGGHLLPAGSSTTTALFASSSRALADDVRWLAESLAGTGHLRHVPNAGRVHHTVTVTLPQPWTPFRHRAGPVPFAGATPARAIAAVEPADRKPMRCIAVAHPDRLYITDHFVVTHNTFTSLLVLRNPAALPALVVTLTSLPRQWLRELDASLPWLRGHIVRSGTPYNLAVRMPDRRDPDVIVINYNKLAGWADHLTGHVRTVIFDEMQELRRGELAQKGVAAAMIADKAAFRLGLTGTPVYNYGDEIHRVVSVLDPDVLGTREEFLREWCSGRSGDDDGKVKVTNPAALGTYLRDAGVMLRRTRADVGRELPEVIRVEQSVETDRDVLDRLAGNSVEMARQVLTSTDRDERFHAAGELNARIRHATGVAKAPYVAEFVRLLLESEPRVLLMGWHRETYTIWLDRLREFRPVMYTGTENDREKDRSFQAFTTGSARVMMMSLRSGAGLDGLQGHCKVIVFGELDWSPKVHSQAIGRLNRDGQVEPVLAYFMLCDEGSDPAMAEVLDIKRQQADPIVDPHIPLFDPTSPDGVRKIKALAEDVLRQHEQRRAETPTASAGRRNHTQLRLVVPTPAAHISEGRTNGYHR